MPRPGYGHDESPLRKWESLVEEKIREAKTQGEFDNLPGKGKPLDLSANPYEDPALHLAHMMLKANGFAPAWIEERKDLDGDIDAAIAELAAVWRRLQDEQHDLWRASVARFERQAAEFNRRILAYNIKAPSPGFWHTLVDVNREVRRIRLGD